MRHLVITVAMLLHFTLADDLKITQASNTFAAELYKELAKTPGNVLVCPVSAHIALALVHQGAAGDTKSELEKYLHLQGTNDEIKKSYKNMLNGLQSDVLKIATSLYPAVSFTPKSSYVAIAKEYFLSEVQALDYGKPVDAAGVINSFVENKTNNKIHDIIKPDSLSDLTRLVIVNAVHFKAGWDKPFPPAFTDYFKVTPSQKVQTQFLGQTDNFFYKDDVQLGAKVLRMDYEKGDYSMVFVLPNKEDGLTDLETKLATTSMDYILKDLKDVRVEVTIPKFKIEKEIQLNDLLMKLGIVRMFDSRADLRGISDRESLAVDSVIQKTFIDVNERGTEAAAATGVVTPLSGGSEENIFAAKRPFIFYLIHNKYPLVILFNGKLVKPEEIANTPPKQGTSTPKEEGTGNGNSSEEDDTIDRIGGKQPFSQSSNYDPSQNPKGEYGGYPTYTSNSQPNPNKNYIQPRPLSSVTKDPYAPLPTGQQEPPTSILHQPQYSGQQRPLMYTNRPLAFFTTGGHSEHHSYYGSYLNEDQYVVPAHRYING